MNTVLNLKVGSEVTIRVTTADGIREIEGKVIEFPAIIRVESAEGIFDVKPDQVIAEKPELLATQGRFRNRLTARL